MAARRSSALAVASRDPLRECRDRVLVTEQHGNRFGLALHLVSDLVSSRAAYTSAQLAGGLTSRACECFAHRREDIACRPASAPGIRPFRTTARPARTRAWSSALAMWSAGNGPRSAV